MEGIKVDVPKILWQNLKGLKVEEFNTKLQSCLIQEEDIGGDFKQKKSHKESWLCNEEIQKRVQLKRKYFLDYLSCPNGADRGKNK